MFIRAIVPTAKPFYVEVERYYRFVTAPLPATLNLHGAEIDQ